MFKKWRTIDKKLNYLQGILLYWIIENSDYFKNEKKWKVIFIWLSFFYLLISYSLHFFVQLFLIQTDNSYHKNPPTSFMYILSFLF